MQQKYPKGKKGVVAPAVGAVGKQPIENRPRGAYTGSFGYLNRDGSLDLNILIRTMVRSDRHVTLRAGAGIVADSDPRAELEETRAKAKGMLRAISQ